MRNFGASSSAQANPVKGPRARTTAELDALLLSVLDRTTSTGNTVHRSGGRLSYAKCPRWRVFRVFRGSNCALGERQKSEGRRQTPRASHPKATSQHLGGWHRAVFVCKSRPPSRNQMQPCGSAQRSYNV
jgi:hypothetical protein